MQNRREPFLRQSMLEDRGAQGRGYWISANPAPILSAQDLSPPFKPDLAGERIAHHLADARNLEVEGIEREERATTFGRREQGAEETLLVAGTDKRLTMREGVHGLRRNGSPDERERYPGKFSRISLRSCGLLS